MTYAQSICLASARIGFKRTLNFIGKVCFQGQGRVIARMLRSLVNINEAYWSQLAQIKYNISPKTQFKNFLVDITMPKTLW